MTTLENIPYDLWDFEFQFADLLDFLQFSESNIEYQRRTKIQSLKRLANLRNMNTDEYRAELANIEGRFDIYLSRSIRYSVLISFAATVEWISNFLKNHATEQIPNCPAGLNKSIHILNTLIDRAEFSHRHNLNTLEKIIKIRNCLVHAMGSVKNYQFGEEVKRLIETLSGFSISDSHFIEEIINIDKGAIEPIINETQAWIVNFIEECRQKSIIEI